MNLKIGRFFFGLTFWAPFSFSVAQATSLEVALKDFYANPQAAMLKLPSRIDAGGVAHDRGQVNWLLDQTLVGARLQMRDQIRGTHLEFYQGLDETLPKDQPEKLVEPGTTLVVNLGDMDQRQLQNGSAANLPWSGSYWPADWGLTGVRYADPQFPRSKKWLDNSNYIQAHPASELINQGNSQWLSPTEKYDEVMGDKEQTLTHFAWGVGAKHQKDQGEVPHWIGLCDGWSAASHMLAAIPEKPVDVKSPSGQTITFFPSDFKALQSMLWSNAHVETRFIGSRCNVKNSPRDENGRLLDQNCFNLNPAAWHLAMINQLGINRRSFVMDAGHDAEVWNYPVVHYQVIYFNPQTLRETKSLASAVIPLDQFRIDRFKKYRSPQTKQIVGIAMLTNHLKAIQPSQTEHLHGPTETLRYIYDLELDQDLNLIGGEWYTIAHPDFAWTMDLKAQAMAPADPELVNDPWTPDQGVSSRWTTAARQASQVGIPLFSFIKKATAEPRSY